MNAQTTCSTAAGRPAARLVLAAGVMALLAWTPAGAQEAKGPSAEDIVRELAGPEKPLTRGVGRVRVEREPGRAAGEGRRIAVPIQFRYDSAEIAPESFPQLRAVAQALRDARLAEARIRVEGHTDQQGGDAYNQALSDRRAEAVRRYLVEREGIPAARLGARGYGKSRPLPGVSQDTEAGRALHRRVELVNLGAPAGPQAAQAAPPPGAPPGPAARPVDTPAAAGAPALAVSVAVTHVRDGETRTLPPGGTLAAGEGYRLTLTPSADGHVYAYQVDEAGQAEPLFPNPRLGPAGNPVRARQTYTVSVEGRAPGAASSGGQQEIVVVAAPGELGDPAALALRRPRRPTLLTRGPAAEARADVGPAAPPGVFLYRLPFSRR
jgi:outer membrane protein OmpA-like peptidoglycan-associated protein